MQIKTVTLGIVAMIITIVAYLAGYTLLAGACLLVSLALSTVAKRTFYIGEKDE